MELLNGPIFILAVKILFLKVNVWHVNAKSDNSASSTQLHATHERQIMVSLNQSINKTRCSEPTSQRIPMFTPYMETYRSPEHNKSDTHSVLPRFRVKSRFNYMRRHETKWTCCAGYVLSGSTCVPQCSQCQKGTCKEPNVCICNQGYRKSGNGTGPCVPVCTNGCVNGTCIDPEVCSCYKDYWLDSDGFTCKPICDTECERNHGYCSEPNVCTCHPGYKKSGAFIDSTVLCEPVCDRECTNGRCAAPNVCMCADGYETDENDPFTCKPKCDQPCAFGTCTAPGTCTCDEGYRAMNASVCEPICSEPCEMGTCVAPESCSCNEGYGHRNGSSKYVCEPICEIDCGDNAKCTAPGVCTCDEGFVYDKTSRMCKTAPHCTIPCGENAECTGSDKCTCVKGYASFSDFIPPLVDWIAIRRERLKYISLPFRRSVCQPVCNFVCINGRCTAPNVCTCSENFYPSWSESDPTFISGHTMRVCRRRSDCNRTSCGDNGMCHRSSGICICNDGYVKDTNGDCVPFCNPACSNGTCTAPNRCDCHDGFASRNESFCEPICERGCQNGDCIGPNHCICHDDYLPNIGHHSGPECFPACALSRNCSGHGGCVMENNNEVYRCECDFGWTGRDCEQPTMCVIMMTYDHKDVNRITIRNDTNSTIMRAQETAPYCECDKSVDDKTLCYVIPSNESNTTFIGCLVNKDSPCYTTPHYSVSINVTKIVWPFVTIAILLVIGLTTATYIMYRKRQKKKLATASPSVNVFMRQSFATEFLLPDHED